MVCCLFCFDDSPLPDDPRNNRHGKFQISMLQATYIGQPTCICTYCFPCCMNYYIRYKVLNKDMSKYTCCQGYMDNGIIKAGNCMEKDYPSCCLCLESFCCLGTSMSASRMLIMDLYDLQPDPMDNRIVRFSNCLQLFACVFDILAIFMPGCDDTASSLNHLAKVS